MAHVVEYKHPLGDLSITVDFTDDLSGDTGLKAMGTTSTHSTISAIDSGGVAIGTTPTGQLTVTGATTTTSMNMTVTLTDGLDGQDYIVTPRGRGNTTTKPAARVVEVRVRASLIGVV